MFSEYVKDSLVEKAHTSSKMSFHLSQAFTQPAIKKLNQYTSQDRL